MSKTNNPAALAAFKKATPAKAAADQHPTIHADKMLSAVVSKFVKETEELKALEGSTATGKAILRKAAFPKWLEANNGPNKFDSTVVVIADSGEKINVTFTNGYRSSLDEKTSPLVEKVIGAEKFSEMFKEDYSLTIKGSDIPKDRQEEFLGRLAELMGEFNLDPAETVTAKTTHLPRIKEFNEQKVRDLDIDTNTELDKIYATPTMVKVSTKGE